MDIFSWKKCWVYAPLNEESTSEKIFGKKWFLRVVCPVSSFNISQNDISALEHAYAPKNRLYASFLTLYKMTIQFFQFSKFSNNLGIRSESSHAKVSEGNNLTELALPHLNQTNILDRSKSRIIIYHWMIGKLGMMSRSGIERFIWRV